MKLFFQSTFLFLFLFLLVVKIKKNDGFCVILESSRLDTGYGVQGSTHVIVRLKYRKLDNGP